MATMYGADADELDRISTQLNETAEELVSEANQMTSTLNNIPWIGAVASAFRDRWQSVNVAHIENASQFLRDAATNLTRQATEQRVASDDNGSGGAGIYGFPGRPGGGLSGSAGAGIGAGVGGGTSGGAGSEGGWKYDQLGGEIGTGWGKDGFFVGASGSYTAAEHGFFGDAGSVKVGEATGGLGVRIDGTDTMIGAFGTFTAAEVAINGTVWGDDDLGVVGGGSLKVLAADASIGYHNGEFGAQAGVNLVSAEGEVGATVGGVKAAISGEIGLKLEAGLSIGPEGAHFDVGPVSFGFSLDW